MSKYFYSKSQDACFVDSVHGSAIPSDCIEITIEQHNEIAAQKSAGRIVVLEDGEIVFQSKPAPSVSETLDLAKNEIRSIREPMLSAVTGIGWDASVSGDTELVKEAQEIRNSLRDITNDPALNAAQTYEEMRAAGVAAYRRIAAGASPAFAATFKEFTGA